MYHKVTRVGRVLQIIRQNLGDTVVRGDGDNLYFTHEFGVTVHQKFRVGLDALRMAKIHHNKTPFALHDGNMAA